MNAHRFRQAHLSTADCWRLLETETVGRIALNGADAPEIFPVNYAASEGAVYIRTAADIKYSRTVLDAVAAFEVDGGDDESRWSVVIRGSLSRVRDEVEIERSRISRLVSWSPRFKPYVIKVTPHSVTGRRFTRSTDRPSASPQSDASPDTSSTGTQGRSGRPVPIPSVTPDRYPYPHRP